MKRVILLSLTMVGFLVVGLLTWTMPAESQDTPGVWKLAGSMSTARRAGGDARLRDGRILAVGGTNTTGVDGSASIFYDTAEIYDPVTATWTAADSYDNRWQGVVLRGRPAEMENSLCRRLERIIRAFCGGDIRPGYRRLQCHRFFE